MATIYTGKIKCQNEPNPDLLEEIAAAPYIKLINNSPNPLRTYEMIMKYFEVIASEQKQVKTL